MSGIVHRLDVSCVFVLRRFLSLLCFLSGCSLLAGESLCSDSDGPDEAQQFTGNCGDDLPLGLAGCAQLHTAFVQPMLRLPCNLFDLFGDALLSSAQSVPDTGWTAIAPRCFDGDSSQVRVAGLGDAPASRSLATGILAGYSTAVAHQLA